MSNLLRFPQFGSLKTIYSDLKYRHLRQCYIYITKVSIRAELEGNWPLHLATYKQMLPYRGRHRR